MSPITTHVLDTSHGKPAGGVAVTLARGDLANAAELASGVTDSDGRIADLLEPGRLEPGVYRLSFEVGPYFRGLGVASFHPRVEIVFEVDEAGEHYHVPLLVSPFGYTTYRGS